MMEEVRGEKTRVGVITKRVGPCVLLTLAWPGSFDARELPIYVGDVVIKLRPTFLII